MHDFTKNRSADTLNEVWFVEHPSVFTQGRVGKMEHILTPTNIPIVQTDRGGQITYHGLGQQIMYVLIDIRRLKLSIRQFVEALENTVINTLAHFNIRATADPNAPGVYVEGKKICSLGLHIQKGCTLHGLALNIDMDLTPFDYINPCGYAGLQMTQVSLLTKEYHRQQIQQLLLTNFMQQIGYLHYQEKNYKDIVS